MYNNSLPQNESKMLMNPSIGGKSQTKSTTNTRNIPYGGFPPIYECTNKDVQDIVKDNTRSRTYSKHKTSVSIKDIIMERKNIEPFLKLGSYKSKKSKRIRF